MMENTKIKILKATADDAGMLADFGSREFEAAFGPDNNPEDMKQYVTRAFAPGRIKSQIDDPDVTFLMAYRGDTLVGYVKLRAVHPPPAVNAPSPLELERIYAKNDLTGKGYGSALMSAGIDHARQNGFKTLWLGVWEHNKRARKFYEKWGFVHTGDFKTFTLGNAVQKDAIMIRSV